MFLRILYIRIHIIRINVYQFSRDQEHFVLYTVYVLYVYIYRYALNTSVEQLLYCMLNVNVAVR